MIVDCAVYEGGRRRDGELPVHEAMEACRHAGAFTWIGLYEPTEEEFDSIRREFELHDLAVEDAIHAHERPKLEIYGDAVFIVLKTARYIDSEEVIRLGEILVFLGREFIITVRHGEASELAGVRRRLEGAPDHLERGPGAVLHAILDQVVDDYWPAIVGLGEDIEEVEDEGVLQRADQPGPADLQAEARGARVQPRGRAARGARRPSGALLEANLAQVTVRQNQDVRTISAIVAILAVPTMLAAIYGMNFEHMPELERSFGYPLALVVMASLCFLLYRHFKRIGWLE